MVVGEDLLGAAVVRQRSLAMLTRSLTRNDRGLGESARSQETNAGSEAFADVTLKRKAVTSAEPSDAKERKFAKTWSAAWDEISAAFCAQSMEEAAWSKLVVEAVGFGNRSTAAERAYRAKVRLLSSTFKRQDNSELRRKVLFGSISGAVLVSCTEDELLSERRRAEQKRLRKESLDAVCVQRESLDSYDPLIICPLCGAAGARYAVLQNRYLVESSSTYIYRKPRDAQNIMLHECVVCCERWQHEESGM